MAVPLGDPAKQTPKVVSSSNLRYRAHGITHVGNGYTVWCHRRGLFARIRKARPISSLNQIAVNNSPECRQRLQRIWQVSSSAS